MPEEDSWVGLGSEVGGIGVELAGSAVGPALQAARNSSIARDTPTRYLILMVIFLLCSWFKMWDYYLCHRQARAPAGVLTQPKAVT
jgi:hypothetical protein